MTWTRRDWQIAAGTAPLGAEALVTRAGQNRPLSGERGRRGGSAEPLPPLGPTPSLPDKASFPNIRPNKARIQANFAKLVNAVTWVKRLQAP